MQAGSWPSSAVGSGAAPPAGIRLVTHAGRAGSPGTLAAPGILRQAAGDLRQAAEVGQAGDVRQVAEVGQAGDGRQAAAKIGQGRQPRDAHGEVGVGAGRTGRRVDRRVDVDRVGVGAGRQVEGGHRVDGARDRPLGEGGERVGGGAGDGHRRERGECCNRGLGRGRDGAELRGRARRGIRLTCRGSFSTSVVRPPAAQARGRCSLLSPAGRRCRWRSRTSAPSPASVCGSAIGPLDGEPDVEDEHVEPVLVVGWLGL